MKHEAGISKAELARQLGVSRAYVTMIANGRRKPSRNIVNRMNSLNVNKELQIFNPKSCSSANSDTSPGTESSKYYSISPNLSQVICRQP